MKCAPVIGVGFIVMSWYVHAACLGPWDRDLLYAVPNKTLTALYAVPGAQSFFYEGIPWRGNVTRVYAYYKTPEGNPPPGGWPAVICVHEAGGTAYVAWIEKWAAHGYAAMAMDLEGRLPDLAAGAYYLRPSFQDAGPPDVGAWGDYALPIQDQWFYHAVAKVIRAHSLLRSFPEINPDQVGITGISWGGLLTCVACGVDERFRFAIPAYGCGFLHLSDGLCTFGNVPLDRRAELVAVCDPSNYLSNATLPMLWLNGTNDPHFPLDVWQDSAQVVKGRTTRRIQVRMPHAVVVVWEALESYLYADSLVKAGVPLPRVLQPRMNGSNIEAEVEAESRMASATLCYTVDQGRAARRLWQEIPASLHGNTVIAPCPSGAKAVVMNVRDDRGVLSSSPYWELPELAISSTPQQVVLRVKSRIGWTYDLYESQGLTEWHPQTSWAGDGTVREWAIAANAVSSPRFWRMEATTVPGGR